MITTRQLRARQVRRKFHSAEKEKNWIPPTFFPYHEEILFFYTEETTIMSWTGERGETLYETCREKGLAITKKKFDRRIRCLNCLTIKRLLENIPDDEPILAYFPAIVTSMKTTTQLKDSFYAAKTGECSKCRFLSGSKEEVSSQLAHLEDGLFCSGEGMSHVP